MGKLRVASPFFRRIYSKDPFVRINEYLTDSSAICDILYNNI